MGRSLTTSLILMVLSGLVLAEMQEKVHGSKAAHKVPKNHVEHKAAKSSQTTVKHARAHPQAKSSHLPHTSTAKNAPVRPVTVEKKSIEVEPQLHQIASKATNQGSDLEATTTGSTPFAPLPFMHFPMMTSPHLVEHLTGRHPMAAAEDENPRSIIVSPSYGPTSGGTWVQVVGAGSYHTPNSLQCKLDLVEQFCYSNHYYYSWCYITPKCAGVYPFRCHNGPLEFEGKYAVVAKTPWVTSVYPFSGDTAGGTPVTVRGWNFEPHCPRHLLCRFGEQVVPAKFYTSSSVMCIAPCSDQKQFVSVEVSNDGGMHWSMSGVQYGYVGEGVDLNSGECQRYIATDYSQNEKH